MSIPCVCVREYIEASENLLKLNDLTDEDLELVQDMLDRLAEQFNSNQED
jgi:hypothetical protein